MTGRRFGAKRLANLIAIVAIMMGFGAPSLFASSQGIPSFESKISMVEPRFRHCFRHLKLSALTLNKSKLKCRGPKATRLRDMFFGDFATLGSRGKAVLQAKSGKRRVTGGLVVISNQFHTAELKLEGIPGRGYAVIFPRQIRFSGGDAKGAKVFLTKIRAYSSSDGRLNEHGKGVVKFGGTLHVSGRVTDDQYRATIPVTVLYN